MKSVASAILEVLEKSPQVASSLYDDLAAQGYPRSQLRAGVASLVRREQVNQSSLVLDHGNRILSRPGRGPDAALVKDLIANRFYGRPALNNLLKCARTSHPALSRTAIAKIAALRVGTVENPDWREVDRVIAGLKELGIFTEKLVRGTGDYWVANKTLLKDAGVGFSGTNINPTAVIMRERFRLEHIAGFAKWLTNNGLTAKGGLTAANDVTAFASCGGVPFDVFGLNYTRGIAKRVPNKIVPQPLVADVLINECSLPYAESFIYRTQQASRALKQPLIAVVLCEFADADAFDALSKAGALVWTHERLFGEKTAKAIQESIAIVERIARQQDVDPSTFAQALDGLENFGSLFGNLKGDLFELIVAYLFQKRGYNCRLGWQVRAVNGDEFDVDVQAIKTNELSVIECKGYRNNVHVSEAEARQHFLHRFPTARDAALSNSLLQITKFAALFVTSAHFEKATEDEVERGRLGNKGDSRYELWDRDKLLTEFGTSGLTELGKLVDRYF